VTQHYNESTITKGTLSAHTRGGIHVIEHPLHVRAIHAWSDIVQAVLPTAQGRLALVIQEESRVRHGNHMGSRQKRRPFVRVQERGQAAWLFPGNNAASQELFAERGNHTDEHSEEVTSAAAADHHVSGRIHP
jgi:hypothetical protein